MPGAKPPKLTMFLGKGGVGKTTVSAAYACARAARVRTGRIALLSSDPAHSLADVFDAPLSDSWTQVAPRLLVAQVNAQKQFEAFLKQHRPELLDLIEQGTFFNREDIEPLLQTTLPGMAEVSALLRIEEVLASSDFNEVVVDTAPMGHTLRLLELPQTFLRFLDFLELAGSRDTVLAETFGGRGQLRAGFLTEWRAKSERLLNLLSSDAAEIVMVSAPEQFSVQEIERAVAVLEGLQPALRVSRFVLNRVPDNQHCSRCARIAKRGLQITKKLRRWSDDVLIGGDDGEPVLGATHLRAFGEEVFLGRLRKAPQRSPSVVWPKLSSRQWPRLAQPLALSVGKGGVGKTTIAAATAYQAAKSGAEVLICSVDPAPSLDDVFAQQIGEDPITVAGLKNFHACEVDANKEYRRWAAPLQARVDRAFQAERSGLHIELAFEREMFSSLLDIVPPGVDELFAVLRVSDLASARARQLVLDMAPTGHALELLRTPERMLHWGRLLMKSLAPHRKLPLAQEIAVEIASITQRVRSLRDMLGSDSERWTVMLAEPLPDRETERLLAGLEDVSLAATSVFINRVLLDQNDCPRCARARAWQARTLSRVLGRSGAPVYVVPEFPGEIAGASRLERFTRKIYAVESPS